MSETKQLPDNDTGVMTPFNESCYGLRERLKVIARQVQGLKQHGQFAQPVGTGEDRGEMVANIMLAYRHLEDAAMRLGKAVQAYDGGTSAYPR